MKRRNVRQHNALRQMQQRETVRPGKVAEQAIVRMDPASVVTAMWEDAKQLVRQLFAR